MVVSVSLSCTVSYNRVLDVVFCVSAFRLACMHARPREARQKAGKTLLERLFLLQFC